MMGDAGGTSRRPVLVTGASGFVGEHVARRLVAAGEPVVGSYLTRPVVIAGAEVRQIDLADAKSTVRLVAESQPRAVIHTAAMTAVDGCRQQPDAARAAIVTATENLARAIDGEVDDAPLVHVSTDLVFDGEDAPYGVHDAARPLSVYGTLKLAAEAKVLAYARGVVVRSALVYGGPTTHKGSFLGWMLAALEEGRPLNLFVDEVRTPVWVADLAAGLSALCDGRATGLFHAGGPERLNRYEMGPDRGGGGRRGHGAVE